MTSPKRMLMLADWHEVFSGFGTVTKNLLPYFKKEFGEIVLIAINYYGDTYQDGNLTVYSAKNLTVPKQVEPDPFGRYSFMHVLANDTIGFDLCFIINDIEIINKMIPTMQQIKITKQHRNQKNFKSIAYFPMDSHIMPKGVFDGVGFFDTLITYNESSRAEVVRHRPDLKKIVKVIPHGTNSEDFFAMPKEEIEAFRKDYFVANADKVIITAVNRNQPRKAIGDTILSFIEAKKLWKLDRKPFLYLHMMDKDKYMSGYDLRKIFSQTDLAENEDYMIVDQRFFTEARGVEISVLRGIYNASDVFVSNSLGEGHGLSVTESLACRCPVVAPNYTSMVDIGGNGKRMYVLEELDPFISPFDSVIRMRGNIYECAEKIVEAAENHLNGTDKEMLDNAEKYIRSFKWNEIAKQFLNYFHEII